MLTIKTLERPKTPNTFLIAPDGYCENEIPDELAPVFKDLNASALKTAFIRAIEEEPRLVTLEDNELSMEFRQRTSIIGWPDFITVYFIELQSGGSTVAIYSRSKYGRSDFGVNRKRIQRWLTLLGNKS